MTPTIHTSQRRRARDVAIVAGVALVIAAGGYGATTTFGPDAYEPQPTPATDDAVTATDQVLRELRDSIAGQYGSQPASGQYATPSDQAMRDLRETVVKLYGPQPSRDREAR
jgi:hypothetical protein